MSTRNAGRRSSGIGGSLKRYLRELVARPQCLGSRSTPTGSSTTWSTSHRSTDDLKKGSPGPAPGQGPRASKSKDQGSFEQILSWTLTEFALRAEQPEDPELPALYRILSEYYAPKVPHIAAVLDVFRQQNADKLPWLNSAELLVGTRPPEEGSDPRRTVDAVVVRSAISGRRKLWLPGQE